MQGCEGHQCGADELGAWPLCYSASLERISNWPRHIRISSSREAHCTCVTILTVITSAYCMSPCAMQTLCAQLLSSVPWPLAEYHSLLTLNDNITSMTVAIDIYPWRLAGHHNPCMHMADTSDHDRIGLHQIEYVDVDAINLLTATL